MVATLIEPKNKVANNIGTRIFGGRMGAFNNSTVKTFQFSLDTEQQVDAVRVLFANGATGSTIAIGGARVVGKPNWTAPNISSGTLTSLTFAGSTAGTIPVAPGASRRGYLWSDWVNLPHVVRDDGQPGSIITVAAYVSTAASITILGNGSSDNYANWATKTNRKVMMRHNDGDCITTPANFTSTTNRIQSPIIGIQYVARGVVRNVLACGDSITDGRGTYIGGGFIYESSVGLSDADGVAIEYSNVAWPGVASATYQILFDDALTALAGHMPDVAVLPIYSPNDTGATPTQANVDLAAARGLRMAGEAARRGVHPVLWTGLPVNTAVYDVGALDAFRVAKNLQATSEWAPRGFDVVDMATPMSGPIDGDGQYPFAAGLTTDGIHPNDAGNTVMAAALTPKLRYILGIAA